MVTTKQNFMINIQKKQGEIREVGERIQTFNYKMNMVGGANVKHGEHT